MMTVEEAKNGMTVDRRVEVEVEVKSRGTTEAGDTRAAVEVEERVEVTPGARDPSRAVTEEARMVLLVDDDETMETGAAVAVDDHSVRTKARSGPQHDPESGLQTIRGESVE